MIKNLVIIPLAGISQSLFWQYRTETPALWALMNVSVAFRRFYTASIAPLFSFCDFAYGSSQALDHNASIDSQTLTVGPGFDNFFATLSEKGHVVGGMQYGENDPAFDVAISGFWPERCGKYCKYDDLGAFHDAIKTFFDRGAEANAPFTLYCANVSSLFGDNSGEKKHETTFHGRIRAGFRQVDNTVAFVLDELSRRSLVENTAIVVFGAHGMDPWRHGFQQGSVISAIPHADMCWTPAFLHAGGNAITTDALMSSIDLKPTLLRILFPDETIPPAASPFSGIDIQQFRREAAFTQNMPAACVEEPAGKRKSYAIVNGEYRLIATSRGDGAGEGGMEMYYDFRDPGNTRNLIDFFDLDAMGNMVSFGHPDVIHPHFTRMFKRELTLNLAEVYTVSRSILASLVQEKERFAFERTKAGKRGSFPAESFTYRRTR